MWVVQLRRLFGLGAVRWPRLGSAPSNYVSAAERMRVGKGRRARRARPPRLGPTWGELLAALDTVGYRRLTGELGVNLPAGEGTPLVRGYRGHRPGAGVE